MVDTNPQINEVPDIAVGAGAVAPARTVPQAGVTYMLCEALQAFHITDLDGRQWAIAMLIGTTAVAWIQSVWERHRGKRLIGTTA